MTTPPKIPTDGRLPARRRTRCIDRAINLKLSDNAQFQDKPGASKPIETAVSRGDQAMAARLPACRGAGIARGAAAEQQFDRAFAAMPETVTKPKTKVKTKTERPPPTR